VLHILNFFIRFEAKLSEYESYSHVLVYLDLMQIKYMLKQIFDSERILASNFLVLVNTCFKIFVLKQIFANLQVNFTLKRIFACKYCWYLTYFIKLYRKAFHKSRASINIRCFFENIHLISLNIHYVSGKKSSSLPVKSRGAR
jgi:hypothetical protein